MQIISEKYEIEKCGNCGGDEFTIRHNCFYCARCAYFHKKLFSPTAEKSNAGAKKFRSSRETAGD